MEERLQLETARFDEAQPGTAPEDGFDWAVESWMAADARICDIILEGTYYPDHVVFLGPALPTRNHDGCPPAIVKQGEGILIRRDATASQRAMLRCLADVMMRLPENWHVEAIGAAAEAELLNWDAEKYRQALASRL